MRNVLVGFIACGAFSTAGIAIATEVLCLRDTQVDCCQHSLSPPSFFTSKAGCSSCFDVKISDSTGQINLAQTTTGSGRTAAKPPANPSDAGSCHYYEYICNSAGVCVSNGAVSSTCNQTWVDPNSSSCNGPTGGGSTPWGD